MLLKQTLRHMQIEQLIVVLRRLVPQDLPVQMEVGPVHPKICSRTHMKEMSYQGPYQVLMKSKPQLNLELTIIITKEVLLQETHFDSSKTTMQGQPMDL